MMRVFLILSICVFAAPAFAQIAELPPECRLLPEHKAAPDVVYQPGVDIHGKAVVPADVNASPIAADQTVVVPLTVDLAQRLQGMNAPGVNMETMLGFLEISPDGRVIYNGQDLTSQVHVLCGQNVAPAVPAADGQTAPDVLKSPPVNDTGKIPPRPVPPPVPAASGASPADQN